MNKIIKCIVLLICLISNTAQARIIFSDDFEWGLDWNTSMGSTIPISQGWSGGILADEGGGSLYVGYVNATGAKQGSRGFVQYWDQVDLGMAQNCWLNTNDITFPGHYYLGYWFKVDPLWDWGGVDSLKVIKTNFADIENTTWDINWANGGNFLNPNEYFVVDGQNWTGNTGCERTLVTDDTVRASFGCWSTINDGQWHYFIWDFNHEAGTLGLKIDGTDAFQMDIKTSPYGAPYEAGVNGLERWNFGGNISAGGGGVAEMYTAYDDVIICTSETEALSFLGVSVTTMTGAVKSTVLKQCIFK